MYTHEHREGERDQWKRRNVIIMVDSPTRLEEITVFRKLDEWHARLQTGLC